MRRQKNTTCWTETPELQEVIRKICVYSSALSQQVQQKRMTSYLLCFMFHDHSFRTWNYLTYIYISLFRKCLHFSIRSASSGTIILILPRDPHCTTKTTSTQLTLANGNTCEKSENRHHTHVLCQNDLSISVPEPLRELARGLCSRRRGALSGLRLSAAQAFLETSCCTAADALAAAGVLLLQRLRPAKTPATILHWFEKNSSSVW